MQLSALTSTLGRFASELHRRKVLRVAAAYVVGAWIVLQVAVALQTAMALSASFSGVILALLVMGLPVAVGLAWFFEITPEGIKRTVAAGDGALVKPQTTDLILAGALGLVVVVALAQWLVPSPPAPTSSPAPTTAEAPKPKPEPPALGDKSIAVLPFANLSPDKENEYFADGLTEELLNLLASIGDLKVISRTSSFAFKGKNTPLPEIAKQLGVRHILEGSIRTDGDDLRITAQLIDVATDTHLWSKTYDRKVESVFSLQGEIAREIAGALKIEVTLAGFGRDALTKDLVAYRFYLEGRNAYHRRDSKIAEATALFKKATERDPHFAEAHAMLGLAYLSQGSLDGPDPIELARKAATTAIGLKPTLGSGYTVLSRLDRRVGRWEAAMVNAQKAIALSPHDSYVKQGFGTLLMMVGQTEAGRTAQLEALRTDPFLDGSKGMVVLAEAARGNEAAADALAESLAKSPDAIARGIAHSYLLMASYDRGDGAKAAEYYLSLLPPAERERPYAIAVMKALRSTNAKRAAIEALMAEASRNPLTALRGLGLLRATDQVLDLMGKTYASGRPEVAVAASLFMWDDRTRAVRSDPRWKSLVRAMGLVDYWKKHGWPDRCRPKGEDDFECS
jgi:TolB-like protein/Flp pilus assembly protein TadD